MLTAPENGAVTNNTDVDTQANYTCDAGYCLYGNRYRTCQSDGNWTGTEPSCFNESKQHFLNRILQGTCKVYQVCRWCVGAEWSGEHSKRNSYSNVYFNLSKIYIRPWAIN